MRRTRPRISRAARLLGTIALLAACGHGDLWAQAVGPTPDDAEPSAMTEISSTSRRSSARPRVVLGSIFGVPGDQRDWTPLPLTTLFSEGWNEPWIAPPNGSSGAVRQGWANSADGLFFRNLVWVYQGTEGLPAGRDADLGLFQFQSPLSRRLWITLDVPFVATLYADHGPSSVASFGDLSFTPRVMLRESQDLSIIAGLGVRTPTGELQTGNGLARRFPNAQFWSDIGHGISLRGGTGVDVPLNNFDALPTNLASNLAIGQTLTRHERRPLGDFTYYLSTNVRNVLGASPAHTYVSLQPGFRTHLGKDFYLAGGYEVPVSGPHLFSDRLTVFVAKGF
ncbi:MAG TPA: hypothetical protein VGX76_13540 [Pirellulales bacterium]|nr:hypothetical protein [Pirellulales bacterium]